MLRRRVNFLKKRTKSVQKVGLALGSGSARGWAHIGVIRALEEAGIRPDVVAGSSIGALVGAVYASGNIDMLEDVILKLDWKQILNFFDVVFPRSGLLDGKKVSDFVHQYLRAANMEELPLPFCAVSTDLNTGKEVRLELGDVIDAVRASISIPGIFTPVKKQDMILVDGGLVNPVPVSVARQMGADLVIAVDVNHDIVDNKITERAGQAGTEHARTTDAAESRTDNRVGLANSWNTRLAELGFPALNQVKQWLDNRDPLPGIFDVLANSLNIMQMQITERNLEIDPPDLLIRPRLGHINFFEFHRAEEIIEIGYREAAKRLKSWVEVST